VKLADTAAGAGYNVRVVSGSFMAWAAAADAQLAQTRRWRWQPVEYRREMSPVAYAWTGARRHAAVRLAKATATRASWWSLTRSQSRAYDELRDAALSERFDMVIGGSVGGLALVPDIARQSGTPSLLDLEDLHTGESEAPDAEFQHACASRFLERAFRDVTVVSTASAHMAAAYEHAFTVRPEVLHNVFTLPSQAPQRVIRKEPLRLYWFSQTIGPGRGLEDVVRAVGIAGVQATLTLRGRAHDEYVAALRAEAGRVASGLTLHVQPPASPARMIELSAEHDIGLSLEPPSTPNRRVCLSNKAFTYLPAGLPVIFSDTPAQRWLAAQLGEAAAIYTSGDAQAMARLLVKWQEPQALSRARDAALTAARERWRWDHPLEDGAALQMIQKALA
jgi:hypothetical protein